MTVTPTGDGPVRPEPPRTLVAWICLGVTVVVALALGTRWLDTSAARVPVLQAAFPIIGASAVGWAVILLVFLRRRVLLAVPALCVALVPLALAGATLHGDTVGARDDDEIVAASNLEFGEADPAALVAQVRELAVDTLVVTELTPEAATSLDEVGVRELLPHRVGSAQPGADGTVILSRHPLTEVQADHLPGLFDQPVATVHAPTGDYTLRAMHPYPPTPQLVRGWHRQLGQAADWVTEQPAHTPLVLAGDFNASAAHPAYRRLSQGMVDAHRANGSGWVRTWPQASSIPPFVQLDHVLVRRGDVVDAGTATLDGTDHALVWARLRLG